MMMKIVNGVSVEMTPQEEADFLAEQAANAARIAVPSVVTMRQAQRALLAADLLDDVEAAIDAIPDPVVRREAQIDWNKSQECHRNWPLVAMLAPAIGLTDAQIDQLFITAATL